MSESDPIPSIMKWRFKELKQLLKETVSTLKPTVGTVGSTSPRCSLYKIVVLPALSKPIIIILIYSLPTILENILEKTNPIYNYNYNF